MKNKELYLKSVDVLLDAFNAGKLEHGSCQACAVGNLIRANVPAFCSGWYFFLLSKPYETEPHRSSDLASTGYSPLELYKIEAAFEGAECADFIKKTQFYGLTAVLNVLREIHEVDTDSHEASQTRLTKIYETLSV